MKIILAIFLMLNFCLNTGKAKPFVSDTAGKAIRHFRTGISAALFESDNWSGNSYRSLLLASDLEFRNERRTMISESFTQIRSVTGFNYFSDSVWIKQNDKLELSRIIKRAGKTIGQSISFNLVTGLFDDYSYDYDPLLNSTVKKRTGGFLEPSSFETGFGIAITPHSSTVINLSLSTARLRLIHEAEGQGIPLKKTKKGMLVFDYGIMIQFESKRIIGNHLELSSAGKFFITDFHKDEIEGDFTAKCLIRVSRIFRITGEFRIAYNPQHNYRLQMKSELLTGIFIEPDI